VQASQKESRAHWEWGSGHRQASRRFISSGYILAPASFHSHCDDYQCYVTPLLGAYIADTYWGRYNTTCVAVVIALIGHIILIVAGALDMFKK
jgi:hypothetical protein